MPSKKAAIKIVYKYWFVILAAVILVEFAGVRHFTQPVLAPGIYEQYQPDTSGNVRLQSLGIVFKIDEQLKKQGLLAVQRTGQSSTSLSFTTRLLARKYQSCDGINGGIGTLTRYKGSSAAMSGHHHLSTVFDYPGFHIIYQAMDSCVAGSPGYSARDLTQETVAARQLWEAIKTARPL